VTFDKRFFSASRGYAEPQIMDLFLHIRLLFSDGICNCKENMNFTHRVKTSLIIAVLISALISSAHALEVPKLQGYVNDYAGMISPRAKAELENELMSFEQTDSTQIVILTVPSLEGDPIENFGIKVAEAWKIGRKGKDNGAIFIVAKQDRKMRIEVGRGLEGKLTDLMSGRIIDLVVGPRFKRGDYDGGFIAGVSAIIDTTRGEFKADGDHSRQASDKASRFMSLLIFVAFAMLILGSISRPLGAVAGAAGLPLTAYLSAVSMGAVGILVLAGVGLAAGLLLPALFSSGGRRGGGGGFGGYYGGGFGGFGGGGGFGSGGGFSGGGGDFGGGGASGGW
jgi:uncharacterized protein